MPLRHAHVTLVLALVACSSESSTSSPLPASDSQPQEDAAIVRCPGRPAKIATPPDTCNGSKLLCDRRFDQVVFPMTHNAMSNADDKWAGPNQTHGIARQLEDGVRGMMLDTHYWDPDAGQTYVRSEPPALPPLDRSWLCHGICQLGRRKLVEGLCDITRFLDAHRGEVFSIIFESAISPEDTEAAMIASGLIEYVFRYEKGTPWPTLREMIAKDTRLVVFTESEGGKPDWYHPAWDLIWDTPYSFKTSSEFTCALNRGTKSNPLFLVNHWLGNPLPGLEYATEVNAKAVLGDRVTKCTTEAGRPPTFVGVDFYEVGDLFEVVRNANGL